LWHTSIVLLLALVLGGQEKSLTKSKRHGR
jgi:hypothetical protein